MKAMLMCAVMAALAACATTGKSPAKELDLREAAFRRAFKEHASGTPRRGPAYCLSVRGEDPDDALMTRFSGDDAPVSKASACNAAGAAVPDVYFRMGEIRWSSKTEASVPITVSEGPMTGMGYSYHLRAVKGRWSVIRSELLWVS